MSLASRLAAYESAAVGDQIRVTLTEEGAFGISFEQHPSPLYRHCARIRSLAPGGQGDRTNRLRPGLVLVRLGANLDCTRLPTYSAVIGAVRGFSARPASLTFATAV